MTALSVESVAGGAAASICGVAVVDAGRGGVTGVGVATDVGTAVWVLVWVVVDT